MPPRVFLHIGTPKSGTTYLQSRFSVNHRRAGEQGLLWPGPSWDRHVAAVRDLRRVRDGGALPRGGAWDQLAREVRGWRGDSVLISMEWLSELTPHQVRVAVESLRPAQVEVVCTTRDLLRSFVAQGQEMTKNARTWTWAEYVDEVLHEKPGPARRRFWAQQDAPAILGRWLEAVPADRVHLVTVPPAGADPEVLWARFCAVLGVDGSGFDQPEQDNASLGVVSTALMQRLNVVAAARGLPHPVYDRALRKLVAMDLLAPRRTTEGPIGVSDELEAFLRDRSAGMVSELQALGIALHGDWADLELTRSLRGRSPDQVTESELLDLCAEVLADLAVSSSSETNPAPRWVGRRAARLEGRPGQVFRRAARLARGTLRRARDDGRVRARRPRIR